MLNALTIDVKDYFETSMSKVEFCNWHEYQSRVGKNTLKILDILADYHVKAIFLVPSSITERYQNLMKKIRETGHEIVDHKYVHLAHNQRGDGSSKICFDLLTSTAIKFSDLDRYDCRLKRNILGILEILRQHGVRATFFVTGRIAERYPKVIHEIYREGHEIACQGFAYTLAHNSLKEAFREDVKKIKKILESITGKTVIGYRSPASFMQESLWAFEILINEGFKYDSSIFPINGLRGLPGTKDFVYDFSYNISLNGSGSIKEFPISTVKILGKEFPLDSGGNLLLPYWFIKRQLKRINQVQKKPFIFSIHPWEINVGKRHIKKASGLLRFMEYVSFNKTEAKLGTLLRDFHFSTIQTILGLPD